MRCPARFCLTVLLVVSLLSALSGAVPQMFSYQGKLSTATGQPVGDGNYNFTFRIFDVATGGAALWTETQTLPVSQGFFGALVGSKTAITLPFDKSYWLETQVAATVLAPRMRLAASPYAIRAAKAESADQAATVPDGSVTSVKLAGGAVTEAKMADLAVTTAKLAVGAVTDAKIAGLAVTGPKLAADSVTSDKIAPGAVQTSDIAPGAVTSEKLAGSISADKVDGFDASATPSAGTLLALDSSAKFPNSVLKSGPGGGLDADTVDGAHASAFATTVHEHDSAYVNVTGDTVTGDLGVTGNLTVNGSTSVAGKINGNRVTIFKVLTGTAGQVIVNLAGRGAVKTTATAGQIEISCTSSGIEYVIYNGGFRSIGSLTAGQKTTISMANLGDIRLLITDANDGYVASVEGRYMANYVTGWSLTSHP